MTRLALRVDRDNMYKKCHIWSIIQTSVKAQLRVITYTQLWMEPATCNIVRRFADVWLKFQPDYHHSWQSENHDMVQLIWIVYSARVMSACYVKMSGIFHSYTDQIQPSGMAFV